MKRSSRFMLIALLIMLVQACVEEETFIANQRNSSPMAETGQKMPVTSPADVHTRYVLPIIPAGDFEFYVVVTGSGSLTVEWGDGQVEKADFQDTNSTQLFQFSHDYAAHPSPISITGDLDRIVDFEVVYYSNSMMEGINTFHLTELKLLGIYRLQAKVLDLRNNEKLQWLAISQSLIGQLKLPKSHNINFVEADFDPSEKVTINMFVDNIYDNAVTKNITGGIFNLGGGSALSDKNKQNLRTLEEVYRWRVHY